MADSITRTLTGVVSSNKADKTITVKVERRVKHPLIGKFIRRTIKLLAHDEENVCNIGDLVQIAETSPYSKRKSWKLDKIIERVA